MTNRLPPKQPPSPPKSTLRQRLRPSFGWITLRDATRRATTAFMQTLNKRASKTSQLAGAARRKIAPLIGFFLPGTYGYGRQTGAAQFNQHNRTYRIQVEVDHMSQDSAQRSATTDRASAENQAVSLHRPAAAVPKKLHRLHPSTGGGQNYDPEFKIAARGLTIAYPHVGTPEEALARGSFEARKRHIEAYGEEIRDSEGRGTGATPLSRARMSEANRNRVRENFLATIDVPALVELGKDVRSVPLNAAQRAELTRSIERLFTPSNSNAAAVPVTQLPGTLSLVSLLYSSSSSSSSSPSAAFASLGPTAPASASSVNSSAPFSFQVVPTFLPGSPSPPPVSSAATTNQGRAPARRRNAKRKL